MKWTLPGFFLVCAAVQTNWRWFLKLPIPNQFYNISGQISIPISPVLWRQEMLFDLVAFSAPCERHAFPRTGNDSLVSFDTSDWQGSICDSWLFNFLTSRLWQFWRFFWFVWKNCTQTNRGVENQTFLAYAQQQHSMTKEKKSRKQLQRNLKPRIFGFVDLGPKRQNNQDCSAIERKINCNIL